MAKSMKQPEVVFSADKSSNELSFYHYGKQVCPPSNSYGPTKRDYFLLHFVTSGKGVYTVGGKTFQVNKNEGFLIRPNEVTFYQADEKEPWEYYFVAFHGTAAPEIVEAVDWIDGYIIKPQNYQSVRKIMKNIHSIKNPERWSEYMVLGELYILLATLIKESKRQKTDVVKYAKEDSLNKAIDYIKNNYDKGIQVADIAAYANMHRVSLYRLFKERLNISVEKYLQNYRMDKAVFMLLNSDSSITEIASNVGMTDYPHFCRQFKKYYGFTPTEYRKKFAGKRKKR
ncbi:MAG: AraC family transcriptional regulator [Clostridia bacterium]|nr:AraC family transcriptional regulator [Clostridia bacterium]